jgi:uncharacterized protein (DUF1501 family)
MALVSIGVVPSFLARTVDAAGTTRRKVLITIFQRGAVDGLNMIVRSASATTTRRVRASRSRIPAWRMAQYAAAADGVLNRLGSEAFDAIRLLKSADPAKYRAENGAAYPRSVLGEALRQIAQLVKADVGLEIAFAEAGGWDTHVNQGSSAGQLATRLDDFGRGIAALARDLGDRMADVVILTMSEFGRAVAENGNRGTDHGHGNAMMIFGGESVRGGRVYGRWPGSRRNSGTKDAISPSRRTSEAFSVRSCAGTSASPIRRRSFRTSRPRHHSDSSRDSVSSVPTGVREVFCTRRFLLSSLSPLTDQASGTLWALKPHRRLSGRR